MVGSSRSVLSDDLLERCAQRAAGYDRENRFFFEDFDELREAKYLLAAVPQEFGGLGLTLSEICQEQRRLARNDATVLGVTYLDNSSASETFVRQQHITYPVVRDVSGNFVRSFGATGVPETFVINRQGRIVALRRYQLDNTWLARTLPRILAEPS